jgi:superkiller protein 3
MRSPRIWPVLALASLVAGPAWADKKLDETVAKAEAQLAKGKEDDALKLLEKAASQAPRDPETQLAFAQFQTRLGKLDDAATTYAKAGEAAAGAPAAIRARVLAGRSAFALRAGTVRDALALARQAVEAEAGGESLGALARAQARSGDPAARATAAKAVQVAPSSAAAHLARGDALLAARLAKEAEPEFRRALELDPRSAAAAGAGLAAALAVQGKMAPALEAARAAVQADPHSADAQDALAVAQLAQDATDKNSEGMAAAQQGAFLEPKSALAKRAVGIIFESRGQLDQAASAYEAAAALDPTWAAPRVAVLGIQYRRGDVEGALKALRALPPDVLASGDAQLLLGRILLKKEDAPGAKAALDKAVAALPGLAEAQAAHGNAAYNVGELKLAADAYGRAVELDPGNVGYQENYGLFLGYDDRLDEGIAVLQKVTSRPDGQDAGAYINLGWVYRNTKPPRVAESVAAYEKALRLDPKNGQAALGAALAYRAGKQWARAIAAYDRAATLDHKLDGEANLGTAWCYYRSGDTYKAAFYTQLAAKSGMDVSGLRKALTARPKATAGVAVPPPKPDDDLAELVDRLASKNAGMQARAVKGLLGLGRPAVPYLAYALSQSSTSMAARESIVDGLGKMGPSAQEALPHLERIVKAGPPAPGLQDSPEEMELKARLANLVGASQAAIVRIRGK